MTDGWVTLTVFDSVPQAEIARGRLLAEAIPCILADRSLLQLGIVAGGIELRVAARHDARAREILSADYSGELD
ncbi:MAG: hypothetical protein V9G63_11345 [Candidatus Competibacter sp.]|jgi:hypothetical protein|nr:DUF2007 domain-containing protein [Candidatus Competibacteraceae bacterium]